MDENKQLVEGLPRGCVYCGYEHRDAIIFYDANEDWPQRCIEMLLRCARKSATLTVVFSEVCNKNHAEFFRAQQQVIVEHLLKEKEPLHRILPALRYDTRVCSAKEMDAERFYLQLCKIVSQSKNHQQGDEDVF